MAKCKLCGLEKTLLKKSHIIPDFMYQEIYDVKHRIFLVEGNNHEKKQHRFTGEYESGILCKECDGDIIGALETYASKAIYGGGLPDFESPIFQAQKNQHGVESRYVTRISYTKMKLFILSILWRACISTRDFFREAKLEPDILELIRTMILTGNPGSWHEFPIMMWSYSNNTNVSDDLIIQPRFLTDEQGVSMVVFVINGLVIHCYLTRDDSLVDYKVKELCLKETNEMNVLLIPENKTWQMINFYRGIKH